MTMSRRPINRARIASLLCGVGILLGWISFSALTDKGFSFTDSFGENFEPIVLPANSVIIASELPDNSVALRSDGTPVAVKMYDAPLSTMRAVLDTPSIELISMRKCPLPDAVSGSPTSLRQLTVVDCSVTDQQLLALTDTNALNSLDVASEHGLSTSALSAVINRHELTHLGLVDMSVDTTMFSTERPAVSTLTSLLLIGVRIEDAAFYEIVKGGGLRTLVVDGTGVSGKAMSATFDMNPKLTEVVVFDCVMSIDQLRSMFGLMSLQSVTVSDIAADVVEIDELRAELMIRFPGAQISLSQSSLDLRPDGSQVGQAVPDDGSESVK